MYSLLAQVKVSKEVAQQRRFESGLLAGYQRLLQLLESRLEPPTSTTTTAATTTGTYQCLP